MSCSTKNPEKHIAVLTNILSSTSTTVSTLIITRNVSTAAIHQMISEGSCDTEDWSNDAENTDLITGINYIIQYIPIENGYFKLK